MGFLNFAMPGRWSAALITAFAKDLNLPWGVVGRLQYDRLIQYSHHNKLKRRFVWSNSK